MKYLEFGTKVTVHSLGLETPGEFRGIIRGISVKDVVTIYIVEMVDTFVKNSTYNTYTIPAACIEVGWPLKLDDNEKTIRLIQEMSAALNQSNCELNNLATGSKSSGGIYKIGDRV